MGGAMRWAVAVAMLALVAAPTLAWAAVQHTVGDSAGWTIQSYDDWSASQTFTVGDTLNFQYSKTSHDVAEVNAADYATCSASNLLGQWQDGDTTRPLDSAGDKYYICTFVGHCPPMKLHVSVKASSTTPSPSSSPSPPPPTNTNTTSTPSPPPPPGTPASSASSSSPFLVLSSTLLFLLAFSFGF